MYKKNAKVTYYVPDGKYCNVDKKNNCRFCMKHTRGYTCAISQEPLAYDGKLIIKTEDCMWPSKCTYKYIETEQITIEPMKVIEATVDNFTKIYNQLRRQGYPENMALSLAKQKMKER